jgi:hypothetical protein
MGRQLPFDLFVTRKVAKWTAHSTLTSTPFISSIGTSPLEEMIFFWNGYKKQSPTDLSASLSNLSYSPPPTNPESTAQSSSPTTTPDEQAINSVLRAVIHRNLRQHTESTSLLRPILSLDPTTLRGDNKDDWPIPVAHYEMAVNLWMQRKGYNDIYGDGIVSNSSASQNMNMSLEKDGGKRLSKEDLTNDARLVSEAKKHIETAKGWGSYSLDARVGMKITAAAGAIKSWEGRFAPGGAGGGK